MDINSCYIAKTIGGLDFYEGARNLIFYVWESKKGSFVTAKEVRNKCNISNLL